MCSMGTYIRWDNSNNFILYLLFFLLFVCVLGSKATTVFFLSSVVYMSNYIYATGCLEGILFSSWPRSKLGPINVWHVFPLSRCWQYLLSKLLDHSRNTMKLFSFFWPRDLDEQPITQQRTIIRQNPQHHLNSLVPNSTYGGDLSDCLLHVKFWFLLYRSDKRVCLIFVSWFQPPQKNINYM